MLAKKEHERWLRSKLKTGWRYGDPRDDDRRLHPSVRPWEELPEDEKDKDRKTVEKLPEIVAAAGMTLARCGEPPELRIEAILPLPKFDFLDDFASPASKEEFLRLLARADKVTELPPRTSRDEAYAAANDRLLDAADLLVAVWDGQDNGGTAETVARARACGLPLAWVHAGNRTPGTTEPPSPDAHQDTVTYERFSLPDLSGSGGWQQREGSAGRTGTGWEAPEDAGWEFLVEHAAGHHGNHRPG